MNLEEVRSKISSFRHNNSNSFDHGYAETVFRTIVATDGSVKEMYLPYLDELLIDQKEIKDL